MRDNHHVQVLVLNGLVGKVAVERGKKGGDAGVDIQARFPVGKPVVKPPKPTPFRLRVPHAFHVLKVPKGLFGQPGFFPDPHDRVALQALDDPRQRLFRAVVEKGGGGEMDEIFSRLPIKALQSTITQTTSSKKRQYRTRG